ncbi:MAG: hypothetical protein H5T62_02535 [Anaerolineae bacterium]|nr:hypothetical protein [Anaerolineae bacterium]
MRRRGRIGSDQVHECANLDQALEVAADLFERRWRRGYRPV